MAISSSEIEIVYKHLSIRSRKYDISEAEREDLVSDSFYKGYEKIDRFIFKDNDEKNRIKALKAWFGRILHNTFLDKIKSADFKKVDRGVDIDLYSGSNDSLNPEETTAREVALEKFWKIFNEVLSEREKEIMLLNLEGNKYSEIAELLEISINTVGSKINSAKCKLKDQITQLEPIYEQLIGI